MTEDRQRAEIIAQVEGLLTGSRQHVQLMQQEMRHLEARREQEGGVYQDLRSSLQALERKIQDTEATFAEFAPEYFHASRAGPPQASEVPPEVKAMSRFRTLLGPAGVHGATSSGLEVENVQKILCWQGVAIPVDGHFTAHTQEALRKWQRQKGLFPDGVVGAATRRALNGLMDGQPG